MSYTRATLAEFQAIFTEFATVTQAQYDFYVVRAEQIITTEFGDDQQYGTMLLTAHYLIIAGIGSGMEAQRVRNFGNADSIKSGDLALSWKSGGSSSSGGGKKSTGSTYGDQVRDMVVATLGGPGVTATGAYPVRRPYGYP